MFKQPNKNKNSEYQVISIIQHNMELGFYGRCQHKQYNYSIWEVFFGTKTAQVAQKRFLKNTQEHFRTF